MSEILRKAASHIRHTVLAGIRSVGGFKWVAASTWRHRRLLILCYHGVSLQNEHEWAPALFVTTAFLRRRFEIIHDRGYVVLPLGEAVRNLRCGTLPPRSVVLTFDDGFYNFHAAAVPLLEEFGYPATNYLSSYYCVHQHPIPGLTLNYLLWRTRLQVLAPRLLPGQEGSVDLQDPQQREKLVANLHKAQVLSGRQEAQQAWLGEVAARLEIDWDKFLLSRILYLMNAAEVADIARRGFDVQLHTHRHRTPRDKSAFCHEVIENRRILEELAGRPATHFCYPSGDVDPVFLPWLRELGVESATTTRTAGLAKAEHDPLLLPRYTDTMAQSEVWFESWLSGAGAIFSRRGA